MRYRVNLTDLEFGIIMSGRHEGGQGGQHGGGRGGRHFFNFSLTWISQ